MSNLILFAIPGDTAKFEKALIEQTAEFDAISAEARNMGCLHHQFGIGDGRIWIVDEWETVEGFQKFFTDPRLQEFISAAGGDVSQPPEIAISNAVPLQQF